MVAAGAKSRTGTGATAGAGTDTGTGAGTDTGVTVGTVTGADATGTEARAGASPGVVRWLPEVANGLVATVRARSTNWGSGTVVAC